MRYEHDEEHPLVREARERAESPIGVPWGDITVGGSVAALVASAFAAWAGWLAAPASYVAYGACVLLLPVAVFARDAARDRIRVVARDQARARGRRSPVDGS